MAQARAQPESNVQFGEGGAGTFSDGKLYSQIKDPRHLGRKVMNEFVKAAGAPEEILYVAHPHIGTFKLVKVVENLREQIIALGGEIRFEQRVTDVIVENDARGQRHLRGLKVLNQATGETTELAASHVVMALGHSSRDTFAMLYERGVAMEPSRFPSAFASSTRKASSTAPAGAATRATRCWARPTTSWCTTRKTAARSTAFACALAARWWPPPASRTAW